MAEKVDAVLVPLKPQYVYQEPEEGETPDKKPRLGSVPGDEQVANDEKPEPVEDKDKFRNRRGSKTRWYDRSSIHQQLCRILIDVPEDGPMPVCSTVRCRYIHDLSKYMEAKPPEISSRCYVYSLKGHCPWGATCLFSNNHLTDAGRNRVDEKVKLQYESSGAKTLTFFSGDLERDLRRRKYDFKRSEEVLNVLPKPAVPVWQKQGEMDFTEDVDITDRVEEPPPLPLRFEPIPEEPIGPCPEDDLFKLHLSEKKKIDWRDKLFMPPMANFGNLPFRRICKEYGADVTCSEPLIANGVIEGSKFDWLLARRHENEDMFGVQLLGTNPFVLTRCTQLLEENTNADFINLHFGNPGDNMRHMRKGGAKRVQAIEAVVRCMTRVTHLPLTVCARLSDMEDVVSCFKACEVSMVTVTSRSKETRVVDWEGLSAMAIEMSPLQVMANSDVCSYREYSEIKAAHPAFASVVMARGALVKPWLFEEVKMKRDRDISSSERFEMIKRFVNYGLENWGSDAKGVEVTRRFLLDWLSFLCRYIPIGLLEKPPQRLTDKCAKYVGRDDMETLLGGQEASDWIKISEMLLGPVPQGFHFTPKVRFWPVDS